MHCAHTQTPPPFFPSNRPGTNLLTLIQRFSSFVPRGIDLSPFAQAARANSDTMAGQERENVMPLRDHFRPPASRYASWEAVHGGWPMAIVMSLAAKLPLNYAAHPNVHRGRV